MATSLSQEGNFGPVMGPTSLAVGSIQRTSHIGRRRGTGNHSRSLQTNRRGDVSLTVAAQGLFAQSLTQHLGRTESEMERLGAREQEYGSEVRQRQVMGSITAPRNLRRCGPAASKAFMHCLMRNIVMRVDPRRRGGIRSMVQQLQCVASRPGANLRMEIKREAVVLLGPELAKEAFAASIREVRRYIRTGGHSNGTSMRIPPFPLRERPSTVEARHTPDGVDELSLSRTQRSETLAARSNAVVVRTAGGETVQGRSESSEEEEGIDRTPAAARQGGSGGGVAEVGILELPNRKRHRSNHNAKGEDNSGDDEAVTAPLLPPEEVAERLRALHKGPQHEDFHLCCVCMVRVRDATLVHGKTAHQSCCYECAIEIKERGQLCPCCRQKITLVVRNYI